MKKKVLFLCTANCVRSQMAEALANSFHSEQVEAVSAGSRPIGWVHPFTIRAMAEIGIDISAAQSKSAADFIDGEYDVVVTVCDSAALDCPSWPGAKRIEHWPVVDPIIGRGDSAARFAATRDEIAARIEQLVATL